MVQPDDKHDQINALKQEIEDLKTRVKALEDERAAFKAAVLPIKNALSFGANWDDKGMISKYRALYTQARAFVMGGQ